MAPTKQSSQQSNRKDLVGEAVEDDRSISPQLANSPASPPSLDGPASTTSHTSPPSPPPDPPSCRCQSSLAAVVAIATAEPSDGATPLPPPPPGASPVAKVLGVEVTTVKKVVPLGLMFFCILFNYTILRDTKDVLVITAKGSSAEIIPFLKTLVNLPMAIGFMLLCTKLSNVLSMQQLFYTCMFPFIAFFGSFAFLFCSNIILFPHGSRRTAAPDPRSQLFRAECDFQDFELLCVLCHVGRNIVSKEYEGALRVSNCQHWNCKRQS